MTFFAYARISEMKICHVLRDIGGCTASMCHEPACTGSSVRRIFIHPITNGCAQEMCVVLSTTRVQQGAANSDAGDDL